MLSATTTHTTTDLQQILLLQQANLPVNLDESEIQSQGFVTVLHSVETLRQMHDLAPSIIIKDNDTVIAYALTMPGECRKMIAVLEPMFAIFDTLTWNGKPLNDYRFYVMGQICIDKQSRGQGLFDMLYQKHKEIYQNDYDFILTEISSRNKRSLRAHERVGFKTIHTYTDKTDSWEIVMWNWE